MKKNGKNEKNKKKSKEHRMHLERIVTIRSSLNIKQPYIPRFLMERSKKVKIEEGNFM